MSRGYSNYGPGLDLVAPGGGRDANIADERACLPGWRGAPIYQITLDRRSRTHFSIRGFIGTSMAAPHVAARGTRLASGVIGENPSPAAWKRGSTETARDLGRPGPDGRYGWGLVDAAAATSRKDVARLHDRVFLAATRCHVRDMSTSST